MTYRNRSLRRDRSRARSALVLGTCLSVFAAGAASAQTLPQAPDNIKTVTIDNSFQLDSRLYQSKSLEITSGVNAGTGSGLASAAARAIDGSGNLQLEILREGDGNDGLSHARLVQTVDGIPVWGTDVKATTENGTLVHVASRTAPAMGIRLPAQVSESEAIAAAVAEHHGGKAAADDYWFEEPSATPVIIPSPFLLETGWKVVTWSEADNLLHHTLIDSSGRVRASELRTSQDRYRVYPDSPAKSGQVIRSGPGNGNAQSPAGWLSGTQYTRLIQGNNVAAYMDRDNNNQPDGGTVVEVTNGDFLAVHAPNSSPTTSQNQDVAVQNLFWLNNIIHDTLYRHGFTESVGNFQNDNFGKGGAGNDSVYAEAQDGGGVNNANFATPGDGSHPRMQMYIWDRTNPNRDGDLDSDIVWHEYGHGLTWRMIGNMSGAVSGAIGEGMSDVLALLQNGDDAVGEYSLNRASGIRSERYGNYSRTIGDFTGTSVHFDGEIYAAALWRAGEAYRSAGLGNSRLMDRLVSGMNFTPSQPTYLEMRDGILRATPSSEDCLIWNAFAEYGMGQGATFTISSGRVNIGESFSVPSGCGGGGGQPPQTTPTTISDLTPFSSRTGQRWRGQVRVTLDGSNATGQEVVGRWTNGLVTRCTTDANRRCTMTRTNISRRWSSVGFTVQTVGGQSAQGDPLTIRVRRP